MKYSREELINKIRLGEDSSLEFKTVRFRGNKIIGPSRNDLADELAAFANADGGVLLLGDLIYFLTLSAVFLILNSYWLEGRKHG